MSHVFHRSLRTELPRVVKGNGIQLIDETGKSYIDASGGAAVSCLGHGTPRVVEAITRQLGEVEFAHTSFFTNAPSEALASALMARAPEGFGDGRAIFVGSGSEAMEVALKLARQVQVERGETSRHVFIAREGAYHGNTLGALSVGGHPGRRALYAPMLMDVARVPAAYAYRGQKPGESEEEYGLRIANALEARILELGPETVAAFVAEPVGGATLGVTLPPKGYFARIREICDTYGVLLIADEVMCGMGRCGAYFAIGQEGVTPDIITIAKGLGAGFQPIAAVMASEAVVATIEAGSGALSNGHTYMSHAVACAAALAVIEEIDAGDLLGKVTDLGPRLGAMLKDRFADHPNVGEIRGRGFFWALELVSDRETRACLPAEDNVAARIKAAAMAEGLICYPGAGLPDGANSDHVVLAPPFIATQADLVEIVDRLAAALEAVLPRG